MTYEKIFTRKNGKQVKIVVELFGEIEPSWSWQVFVSDDGKLFRDVCLSLYRSRMCDRSDSDFRRKVLKRKLRYASALEMVATMQELAKKISDSVDFFND